MRLSLQWGKCRISDFLRLFHFLKSCLVTDTGVPGDICILCVCLGEILQYAIANLFPIPFFFFFCDFRLVAWSWLWVGVMTGREIANSTTQGLTDCFVNYLGQQAKWPRQRKGRRKGWCRLNTEVCSLSAWYSGDSTNTRGSCSLCWRARKAPTCSLLYPFSSLLSVKAGISQRSGRNYSRSSIITIGWQ